MNCKNTGMGGDDRLPQIVGCSGQLPPISRQPSVYSLTFDEFQDTLGGAGKGFGSMNMEELLKNISSAEENQLMPSSDEAALTGFHEACGSGSGLQRQGSLMTLPRTISLKTVDEVWRDLFRENGYPGDGGQTSVSAFLQTQKRQPTLGEVTLEEFLVRAGVVREEPVALDRATVAVATPTNNRRNDNNLNNNMIYGDFTGTMSNGSTELGFPSSGTCNECAEVSQPIEIKPLTGIDVSVVHPSYVPSPQPCNSNGLWNHEGVVQGGGMIRVGDTELSNGILAGGVGFGTSNVTAAVVHSPANPASDKFGGNNGDLSSLSPISYMFERGQGKRGGQVQKAIERRQKRMIKNRESAARSRARKQAYTRELETEVAKLKEQNQELQKKQENLEVQKKQVLEMIIQQPVTKKCRLRRTQTGPR